MELWIIDGIIWSVCFVILAEIEPIEIVFGKVLSELLTAISGILLLVTTLAFPFIAPEPLRTGFKVLGIILGLLLVITVILMIISNISKPKDK